MNERTAGGFSVGEGVVLKDRVDLEEFTIEPGECGRVHTVDRENGLVWIKLDRYHWSLARDRNCFVMPNWLAVDITSKLERNPVDDLTSRLAFGAACPDRA